MIAHKPCDDVKRTPQEAPQARLEMAFIDEFLSSKGFRRKDLHLLSTAAVRALMVEACMYASNKLAEIETRSNLVKALHGNE